MVVGDDDDDIGRFGTLIFFGGTGQSNCGGQQTCHDISFRYHYLQPLQKNAAGHEEFLAGNLLAFDGDGVDGNGDSTIVEVDAYLKKEFKGLVTEIANSADGILTADQVTNFKVKVRILEESYKDLLEGRDESYSPFRPGMTATVDIITNKRENVVGVPISAIVIKTDTSSAKFMYLSK